MVSRRPVKKVMMNHSLAKALMEAGVEHFDSGGTVYGANGTQTTAAGVSGSNQFGSVNSLSNVGSAFDNPIAATGGGMKGIGADFTAQNGFYADTPNISQQEGYYTSANEGQNALAKQLQAQANGQGPNPALAQLQETTQANGQNAAGLVASQRGMNPGLAARLASQQQVEANQKAAGQGATLAAQQQLSAEQGLASVYGQQENAASQNASVVNQGELGSEGINAQTAQKNTDAVNKTTGGMMNGAGSALAMLAAKGGVVGKDGMVPIQKFDWGGVAEGPLATVNIPNIQSGSTDSSKDSSGTSEGAQGIMSMFDVGGKVPGKAKVPRDSASNDIVPAMLSKGEVVLDLNTMNSKNPPEAAKKFVQALIDKEAEKKKGVQKFSRGGKVSPGQGLSAVLQAQASLHDRLKKLEGKKAS
jgi:hypothetical protein